jgi:eukaryotic-like serine/threonine-protein kinase
LHPPPARCRIGQLPPPAGGTPRGVWTGVELAQVSGWEELAIGTAVGEYRIAGTIAFGGMGTVYAAVHPLIGKKAAIKVISRELSREPDAVERFLFEARAVNEIGDPNIVDIFGFGTLDDGRVYMVMEWLVGESLGARCRVETLTVREAVHIVRTVARTLETVHACGFIHRDLKPDNVFLASRRNVTNAIWPYDVKLLDFGIAKLVAGNQRGNPLTQTGFVIGTPRYLSPEQARGLPVDAATDVYSLGVLTYELLTGVPPFAQGSPVEVMAQHIHRPPMRPRTHRPDMPESLEDLVVQMLAKDPRARPGLVECRHRLEAALEEAAATDRMPIAPVPEPAPAALPAAALSPVFTPPPGRFTGPKSGVGFVVALGATVVLAAVLIGAALLGEPRASRDPADLPPPISQSAAQPPPSLDAAPAPDDMVTESKPSPPRRRRRPRRPVDARRPFHLR